MPGSRSPRSLADDLRTRNDTELDALLNARPDLLAPLPADTASLAARASTRASVQRALDRLDTPALQVVEVVAALDQAVGVREIAAACSVPQRVVSPIVASLRSQALLWGSSSKLRLVRAAEEALGPHPAGLGPPLADLLRARSPSRLAELCEDLGLPATRDAGADLAAVTAHLSHPEAVAKLLAGAPTRARDLVDRLAAGPPVGSIEHAERDVRRATASSPLEWLLAHSLLVATGRVHVALPREVGIAMRGGRVRDGLDVEPPDLPTTQRRPEHVDGAAAGQASETVRLIEQLIESWSHAPAPLLRAGGLGIRQLRRVAELLEVDADQAAFLVELSWAAGLVADNREADPAWMPTPGYDDWLEADVAARWSLLATTWRATSRVPGLVGTRNGRDAVRTPLADDLDRPSVVAVRRDVLAELAALPQGEIPHPDALIERIAWRAPRRAASALAPQMVSWTLREAAWLGVTGIGSLAAAGRRLAEGVDADVVREALAATLPDPVDHVLLQADLTAVAPGPLRPELARELSLLADVDSRGGATVYRFTPGSIRRALDAGRSADELLGLLAAASRTPVPQPLEYLVGDVARRHGRIRVGTASAYVRADDESALAEILADRRHAVLRLRRLAPTVLATQSDPATVLAVLRDSGLAPAVENLHGEVVVRRPDVHRTGPRDRPRPLTAEPPAAPAHLAQTAVDALRAGDAVAAERARHEARSAALPVIPALDPASSLAALREAAADRRAVWVGMADPAGGTTRRHVEPLGVDGGRVTVLDSAVGQVRTLSVHRITGVVAAG